MRIFRKHNRYLPRDSLLATQGLAGQDEKTTVEVFGASHAVRSTNDPEPPKKRAEYMKRTFHELMQQRPMLTPLEAAALASINLTDQLCKEGEATQRRAEDVLARIAGILRLFEKVAGWTKYWRTTPAPRQYRAEAAD